MIYSSRISNRVKYEKHASKTLLTNFLVEKILTNLRAKQKVKQDLLYINEAVNQLFEDQ